DPLRTMLTRVARALAQKRSRNAAAPRRAADVHEFHVPAVGPGRGSLEYADDCAVVLREIDELGRFVVLLERWRLGNLRVELGPKLLHDRLIGLGGAADVHATR